MIAIVAVCVTFLGAFTGLTFMALDVMKDMQANDGVLKARATGNVMQIDSHEHQLQGSSLVSRETGEVVETKSSDVKVC